VRRYGARVTTSEPDDRPVTLRRILPGPPGDVTALEAYRDPARGRRDSRPWVIVTMVSSADGATALEGRAGGLGSEVDQAVFLTMRTLADVVLVGAGTVRAERYGPPARPGQRVAVVTRSGRLDTDSRLFTSGAGLVITTEEAPDLGVETIRAGRGDVDLAEAIARLPGDVVACEGGPVLNGRLLAAGCVDEWCLTMAPMLVGGASARASHGPEETLVPLRLAHLLEADGFLFVRYVRS
jgi:riboflavin biosynthesis pyrimidine reductase